MAAAAVCRAVVPAGEIDDLLMSLVDKSLLHVAQTVDGTARFRMLETIREFGMERMAEQGVVGDARLAHADFFAARVADADHHLRTAAQLPWFAMLDVERDNILAAIKYLGDVGRAEDAIDLVAMLGWHWMTIGNHSEIATWVSFALEAPGEVEPVKRLVAEAFLAVNMFGWIVQGDADQLAARHERMRYLSRELALVVDRGDAPTTMALLAPIVAMFADDADEADRLTTIALEHDDPWIAAAARIFRAAIAENTGNVARMREDARLALAAFRDIGERWGLMNSLQVLGALELMDGHLDEAATAYRDALDLASEMNSREDVATMRLRLADVLTRSGDLDGALEQAQLGREAAGTSGSPIEMLFMSLVDVEVARSVDDLPEALRLRDAAIAALRELPDGHPIHSHGLAVVLASAAKVELDLGHGPAAAWPFLDESYELAAETRDTPILAATGVALSIALHVMGQPEQSAEVLGASAQLRGADDWTQLDIARLSEKLGDLEDGPYADAYARGRAMTREAAIARVDPRAAR
jgi:tetratricopeptide (TPR) repeat protein